MKRVQFLDRKRTQSLIRRIGQFNRRCAATEYADTGEAIELLSQISCDLKAHARSAEAGNPYCPKNDPDCDGVSDSHEACERGAR